MKQDQEVSLKVRIITYAVTALLVVVMAVGSVAFASWQRNQKLEQQKQAQIAAQLKRQQLANVEKIKATLPLFRSTKQGENKIMVKVNQSELPKTITAELTSSECYEPLEISPGTWSVSKDGSVVAYYTIAGESAGTNDFTHAGDWAVNDGSISVPSAEYGTYTYSYLSSTVCHPDFNPDAVYYVMNHYTFKIVPPCPTSVTLTH